MLFLAKRDIEQVFTMRDAIEADKKAFRIFSEGGSDVPLRTNISVPKYEGQALFMPGYVEELDCAGVKVVSVFPQNKALGKPSVPSTMVLVDATTGEVNAIMDGTYLTQMRTGAAAGAATELLARKDAKIGAMIGTGGQAAAQLEAMLTARDLTEVRIFSTNLERAKSFAARMTAGLSRFKAVLRPVETSAAAVEGADIITTVTTAKKPVFDGRLLKPGAHINAVGSYMPIMQEIDEETVLRADKIFCESKEAVLAEAGDIIVPLQKGLITPDKITGEIGKVVLGQLKGRESDTEITLFKSVGMAVVDVVTAHEIYIKAQTRRVGMELHF